MKGGQARAEYVVSKPAAMNVEIWQNVSLGERRAAGDAVARLL